MGGARRDRPVTTPHEPRPHGAQAFWHAGWPGTAAKKARIEHLYAIAGRDVAAEPGDPQVVICVDEFGPLNLQPRPGRQWAPVSGKGKEPGRAPRRRMRATYTRTQGARHLFAAYDLGEDKLYGHIKPRKTRARFLEFCRYLRSLGFERVDWPRFERVFWPQLAIFGACRERV